LEKSKVLSKLESAKQQKEELKDSLDKAQTEELQARQDSELALLRAQEIKEGITDESSVAAKAQADVAKLRHTSAVAELESVKLEFLKLQEQCSSLVTERDITVRKAEEAVLACREVEMKVEELTLELISAKENLEAAHSAHLEAEEHRIGASLVGEQDCLTWDEELKEREEELKILNEKYASTKDLKSKLNAATSTLDKLKAELAAYMETKLFEEMTSIGDDGTNEAREIKRSIDEALEKAKKELEEVRGNVDKAKNKMEILKVANISLKSELDNEKAALLTLQQREGMASIAVASLETELDRTKEELEVVSCCA
jgi:chromosome segregation ATPase